MSMRLRLEEEPYVSSSSPAIVPTRVGSIASLIPPKVSAPSVVAPPLGGPPRVDPPMALPPPEALRAFQGPAIMAVTALKPQPVPEVSLLSKFGGAALKGVAALATGGPIAAASSVIKSLGGGGGTPARTPVTVTGGVSAGGPMGVTIGGGVSWTPGGGSSYTGGGTMPSSSTGCPRGYHPNKHPLRPSRRFPSGAARGVACVRNRSMNPLNGKAAMRSLRRLKRAAKATRKIHAVFHRRAPAKATRKR